MVRDALWRGPAHQPCRNAAAVSERFDLSRRRDKLTFSHHAEVASLLKLYLALNAR